MMRVKFETLLGKTIRKIVASQDQILFYTDTNCYLLQHDQNCCEQVYVESIVGELDDLLDSPITLAEEVSNNWNSSEESRTLYALMHKPRLDNSEESYTWTFYKLATINGYVDIRWYGSSNGYYSETVDFYCCDD